MATGTPSDVKTAEPDVSIDLPGPAAGWKKKFTPKKGATPGKGEVVFIAPDGEEIKTKTQLRNYLKSHPAEVTAKDFVWSTGDTPRRSSRLSGKSKASESPENETPEKKQRKSSSKKATKEKGDGNEDEATPEGTKEALEASNVDAQDTVEHGDKDVVTEKDAAEDPVKGGDVGEPAAEEEKAVAEGHEAAPEEQKTDAMELDAAGEEHKSDAVKEQEAATAAAEEEKSDAVKEEEEDTVAVEEQKKSEDVKEQVASADVIEEAVDMDVLLGTDDNEATDAVIEDVQLEIGDGVTDKKKEGDQVSDSSKQSNGGGEEKGVENASFPSQVSEEWPTSEQGPSEFLESLPADFLTNPFTQPATQVMNHPTKAEETADPVGGGEAHKESVSKDEAGNQTSVAAGDDDTGKQKANIEEKQKEDP